MLQTFSLGLVLSQPLLQRKVLLAAGLQTDGQLQVVCLKFLDNVVDRRFGRQDGEHVVVVGRQTLNDQLQVGHVVVASLEFCVVGGASSLCLLQQTEIKEVQLFDEVYLRNNLFDASLATRKSG